MNNFWPWSFQSPALPFSFSFLSSSEGSGPYLKAAMLPSRLFSIFLSVRHVQTHIHTHSSNYGNQQADPISVSCLLSPGGWLPDHLTLHNLICNDRVWHPDFWPYQQLVCVCLNMRVWLCVYVWDPTSCPTHVWLQFAFTKLLPGWASLSQACEFRFQRRSTLSVCDSGAACLLLWGSPLSQLVKGRWTTLLICSLWGEAKQGLSCSPWYTSAAHTSKLCSHSSTVCR